MSARLLAPLLVILLSLTLAPAAAADTSAAEPLPAACSMSLPALDWTPVPAATTAACTADCWNGSQVSCTGASCYAVDSSCPDQRGYCWGSDTGYRYCPRCCSSTIPCWKIDGWSCSPDGSHTDCMDGSACYSCRCWNGTWLCP
jgi:hypothetical protein